MRTEKEIIQLLLQVAKEDQRIRSVIMVGSRANPDCPKDCYQDYDILYTVTDMEPFYNNMPWICEKFGIPKLMQMPELMTYPLLPPVGDGHFTYLMIFEDNIRIDLSVDFKPYQHTGEPALLLLDKDNTNLNLHIVPQYYNIEPPQKEWFSDVCNEFWWCLNNVAKGIARDELPYVMEMYHGSVRAMLNQMVEWYIGVNSNFSVSAGKMGKYFKKYLPKDDYEAYLKTYSDCTNKHLLDAIYTACDLFSNYAISVAKHFGFCYNVQEEKNMREYFKAIVSKSSK